MDKRTEQFLASAKRISLTDDERSAVRDALFVQPVTNAAGEVALTKREFREGKRAFAAFMRNHPAHQETHSFFSVFSSMFHMRLASAAMVAVLLVSISGGAAYAAEDALPGDMLYPVKTNFSEPLRERLHFNREARARFIGRRIERRLKEAEMLMEQGEVPEELLEHLQQRIEHHTSRMEQHLETLPAEVPDELREKLEQRLERHQQILTEVQSGNVSAETVQRFMKKMKGHHKKVRDRRRQHHEELRVRLQSEPELRARLQEKHTELLEKIEATLPDGIALPPIQDPRQIREVIRDLPDNVREEIHELHRETREEIREELQEQGIDLPPPRKPGGPRPGGEFKGKLLRERIEQKVEKHVKRSIRQNSSDGSISVKIDTRQHNKAQIRMNVQNQIKREMRQERKANRP